MAFNAPGYNKFFAEDDGGGETNGMYAAVTENEQSFNWLDMMPVYDDEVIDDVPTADIGIGDSGIYTNFPNPIPTNRGGGSDLIGMIRDFGTTVRAGAAEIGRTRTAVANANKAPGESISMWFNRQSGAVKLALLVGGGLLVYKIAK